MNFPGEGRFYSRMSFADRPKEFLMLTTRVNVRENSGAFALDFNIDGYANVPVVLELCFRREGALSGVERPESGSTTNLDGRSGPAMETDPDSFVLKNGFGVYECGGDRIEFGPGVLAHNRLRMEGEHYSVYNGHLRAQGLRVYLTGITPFRHTLKVQ